VAVEPGSRSRKRGILMPRMCGWIVFGLAMSAPALLAQTTATAPATAPAAHHHRRSHKTSKPIELPPLPSGPLRQLPMDQIPSTPAKVSFQDGLLTISAQNSTLGEILRDVRQLTGASIEIPPGPGANERVITHLGPGAPRDVLAGLLNGSSFNYVMMGSASDPFAISSVMLMSKQPSPGDVQTAANVYQAPAETPVAVPPVRPFSMQQVMMPQPGSGQPGAAQPAAADAEDKDDEKDDDSADDSDDQAQTPSGQPGAAQDQQPGDPNQPNAGPKTPEQILEMLRRQQPGQGVIPPPQPPQ
jgi:hypothetical protein